MRGASDSANRVEYAVVGRRICEQRGTQHARTDCVHRGRGEHLRAIVPHVRDQRIFIKGGAYVARLGAVVYGYCVTECANYHHRYDAPYNNFEQK